MDDIGVFEAMYSQRQFTRYKSDPVPLDDIKKIFDAATKAPSGGNKQPWHFIAITEREHGARAIGFLLRLCCNIAYVGACKPT